MVKLFKTTCVTLLLYGCKPGWSPNSWEQDKYICPLMLHDYVEHQMHRPCPKYASIIWPWASSQQCSLPPRQGASKKVMTVWPIFTNHHLMAKESLDVNAHCIWHTFNNCYRRQRKHAPRTLDSQACLGSLWMEKTCSHLIRRRRMMMMFWQHMFQCSIQLIPPWV
jgi:hypothetical protein